MNATVTIAGNLHAAALETAYARMGRGAARFRGFESEEATSRLRQISETFSLSAIEQDLLLFAAAPELAPAIPDARALLGAAGCPPSNFPTVQSAYELFGGDVDWLEFRNALREDAALRHWRLLSLTDSGDAMPMRGLIADPRIVEFLLGGEMASERVCRVARWRAPADAREYSGDMARVLGGTIRALEWFSRAADGRRIFFALSGGSPAEMEEFAQSVMASVGMPLLSTNASVAPADRTLVLRESLLARAGLLVHDLPPAAQSESADEWYGWLTQASPVVFLAPNPNDAPATPIARPAALEQHAWVRVTLPASVTPKPQHKLGELAQRIVSIATWEDLVLPLDVKSRLEDLCRQAHLQQTVLVAGGFGRKLARGRGVTGLFCGPSGTGKTMAAEVIAQRLQRELYRVDFARIVSKYIGETEKNLRQIFTEAERARCVLFFDEADALFGKRTEVRDSHDRYANLEVSYLLQLFEEAENAVVLLASNRRQSIDDAFARRFRFVVDFPMPNAALRRELWRSSFSTEIPLDGSVRLDVLAERLQLSGASIRNIALAAAFRAVSENGDAPGPVLAAHIVYAARRELEKLSSPMPVTASDLTALLPAKRTAR